MTDNMVLKYSLVLIVVILVAESLSKSETKETKGTKEHQFTKGCNKICRLRELILENKNAEERQNKNDWNRNTTNN